MIKSIIDDDTKELFETGSNRRFAAMTGAIDHARWSRVALRKLIQMNRAVHLSDLRVPPGNRLKAGRGQLSGWYSIRINDQWRIYFKWTDSGPEQVHIDDKH